MRDRAQHNKALHQRIAASPHLTRSAALYRCRPGFDCPEFSGTLVVSSATLFETPRKADVDPLAAHSTDYLQPRNPATDAWKSRRLAGSGAAQSCGDTEPTEQGRVNLMELLAAQAAERGGARDAVLTALCLLGMG